MKITVIFKDGRSAEYTAAILDQLMTDDSVDRIINESGDTVFVNHSKDCKEIDLFGFMSAIRF